MWWAPRVTPPPLARAFGRLSAPTRAAIWMVAAATAFTAMLSTVRVAAAEMHPFEIAFFRYLVTILWMAPFLARFVLQQGLPRRRLGLFGLRAVLGLVSTLAWYWGVPLLALSDAITINFTAPLFATLFAALILGEVVRLRRWSAVALGFVGVLIVIRPGFTQVSDATLIVLAASASWGAQHILVKLLSHTEPVALIVAMHSLLIAPLTLVAALFVWTCPSWEGLLWVAALGTFGTIGHLFMTRAFATADASFVLPFDFAKLPIGVLLGYLAFGETTDGWTWLGAAVIVSSTAYIARREAQLARQTAAAGPSA